MLIAKYISEPPTGVTADRPSCFIGKSSVATTAVAAPWATSLFLSSMLPPSMCRVCSPCCFSQSLNAVSIMLLAIMLTPLPSSRYSFEGERPVFSISA